MTPRSDGPDAPQSGAGEEAGRALLLGLVDGVVFHDESTLFTVLRIVPEAGYKMPGGGSLFAHEHLTAVGRTAGPVEGTRVRLVGVWGRHPIHGQRFEFEVLQPLPPIDEAGLVRYLASKTFRGVGKALAGRIVERLGSEALERIREDPACLDGIRGLRPQVAERLRSTVVAQLEVHRAYAFLHGLGLGAVHAQRVIDALGADCEGLLRSDPYRLTEIPSLGFQTADGVAQRLGFAADDPRRLSAALLQVLASAANEGHSFQRLGPLLERARRLLRGAAERSLFLAALEGLEAAEEVVLDRTLAEGREPFGDDVPCYLPWLATSERGLAESFARLLRTGESVPMAGPGDLVKAEQAAGIELHADQRAAVLRLLSSPVALLTGGPGVGKTTIVRVVVNLAEAAGAQVELASPTGRAAKRLAEATGRRASTIHRLLRFSPAEGGFERDREHPLRAGLVIVDEISMLDVVLAHHLLKAIEPPTRLVLVGDPNQLPSVGPGNVLADLLRSRCMPIARLSHIYRQAESSLIVANAHRILGGELPRFPSPGDRSSDFYLFTGDQPTATANLLVDVVTRRIPEAFGFDWTTDVQVIAPMYRGECGVDELNERLREAQGSGGQEIVRGGRRWRTGDRVIHTRNDYEKEVFNGDMGCIVSVSSEGIVTVRYPEQDVTYSGSEFSDLRPAFAITVHRSQGGEFPVVVMPLVTQHAVMLQRNLLYTAITRARKLVVLVGSRRALAMAVDNAEPSGRGSALAHRLAGTRLDSVPPPGSPGPG